MKSSRVVVALVVLASLAPIPVFADTAVAQAPLNCSGEQVAPGAPVNVFEGISASVDVDSFCATEDPFSWRVASIETATVTFTTPPDNAKRRLDAYTFQWKQRTGTAAGTEAECVESPVAKNASDTERCVWWMVGSRAFFDVWFNEADAEFRLLRRVIVDGAPVDLDFGQTQRRGAVGRDRIASVVLPATEISLRSSLELIDDSGATVMSGGAPVLDCRYGTACNTFRPALVEGRTDLRLRASRRCLGTGDLEKQFRCVRGDGNLRVQGRTLDAEFSGLGAVRVVPGSMEIDTRTPVNSSNGGVSALVTSLSFEVTTQTNTPPLSILIDHRKELYYRQGGVVFEPTVINATGFSFNLCERAADAGPTENRWRCDITPSISDGVLALDLGWSDEQAGQRGPDSLLVTAISQFSVRFLSDLSNSIPIGQATQQRGDLIPDAPQVRVRAESFVSGYPCLTITRPDGGDAVPALLQQYDTITIVTSDGREAVIDRPLDDEPRVRRCDLPGPPDRTKPLLDLFDNDGRHHIALDETIGADFFRPFGTEPIQVEVFYSNPVADGAVRRVTVDRVPSLLCGSVDLPGGEDAAGYIVDPEDVVRLTVEIDTPPALQTLPCSDPTTRRADWPDGTVTAGVQVRSPNGAVSGVIGCRIAAGGPGPCDGEFAGIMIQPGAYEIWPVAVYRGVTVPIGEALTFTLQTPGAPTLPDNLAAASLDEAATEAAAPASLAALWRAEQHRRQVTVLSWTAPGLDGGESPTAEVEIDGDVFEFEPTVAAGGKEAFAAFGLAEGAHRFRVRYSTTAGTGEWSSFHSFDVADGTTPHDYGTLDLRRPVYNDELDRAGAPYSAVLDTALHPDHRELLAAFLAGEPTATETAEVQTISGLFEAFATVTAIEPIRLLAEIELEDRLPHSYLGTAATADLSFRFPDIASLGDGAGSHLPGFDAVEVRLAYSDGSTTRLLAVTRIDCASGLGDPAGDCFVPANPTSVGAGRYTVWPVLVGTRSSDLGQQVISQPGGLGPVMDYVVAAASSPIVLDSFEIIETQDLEGNWLALLDNVRGSLMGVHTNGDSRDDLRLRILWTPPGQNQATQFPRESEPAWRFEDLARSQNTVPAVGQDLVGIHRVQVEFSNDFGTTLSQAYEFRIGFQGYQLIDSSGRVYSFGPQTPSYVDPAADQIGVRVALAAELTSDGKGTWIGYDDGLVEAAGDATVFDTDGNEVTSKRFELELRAGEVIADIVANPIDDGVTLPADRGYWVVTSFGRIIAFGPAPEFDTDVGDEPLNQPIVGAATVLREARPTSTAVIPMFMVAGDGGVFVVNSQACGASCPGKFLGSMGGVPLNQPVVDIVLDPDTTRDGDPDIDGYWLFAADGGVFTFSDDGLTEFHGSAANLPLNAPIIGAAGYGDAYSLFAADGGAFVYGNGNLFFGSLGGQGGLPERITTAAARYEVPDFLRAEMFSTAAQTLIGAPLAAAGVSNEPQPR